MKGKVDNWRLHRKGVLLSGMFKEGTTETQLWELPFDDELGGGEMTEDEMRSYYENAMRATEEWNKKHGR